MTRRILAIHIMKTGGTSLRSAMQSAAGHDMIYPSDRDLEDLPGKAYPGPRSLLRSLEEGRARDARVLIGHVPYVFADAIDERPRTVTLLRDPVARTVSIMEHRRRHSPRFRDASYGELLQHDEFVTRQVEDYQTKIFAFDTIDECPEGVNVALAIDDARFQRAIARLEAIDILGLTDNMPAFFERLERTLGCETLQPCRVNRGRYEPPSLSSDVLERIHALTARDRALYGRAEELVAAQGRVARRLSSIAADVLAASMKKLFGQSPS